MKKIAKLIGVLVLLGIVFWIWKFEGADAQSKQRTLHDLELHKNLLELDRSFLTNLPCASNALTSGNYTLDVCLAGQSEKLTNVLLGVSNGQITNSPLLDLVQNGNEVYWVQYDYDQGPFQEFVGLIDGDAMWGRVYVAPGQGWRQGEPPNYGVWRMTPKKVH
jgi:hypothetical protein